MSNFGFWRPADAPKYWKTKHLGIERKNMIEIFDFGLTSILPKLLSLDTDFSPDLRGGGQEHKSLSWPGQAGTDDAKSGLAWPARLPDPVMDWSGLASWPANHLAMWPASQVNLLGEKVWPKKKMKIAKS